VIHEWRTGSTKTNAAGDRNGDGFNEREGCYELNGTLGVVYFWFNEDSSRSRYTPAFKINGYPYSLPPIYAIIISADERVRDTCWPARGDMNCALNDAADQVVFQINRNIGGPCLILCTVDPNLAVEMNDFSGVADSGECRLFWTTESEQDNLGFRLLRRVHPPSASGAPGRCARDTLFTPVASYENDKGLLGMLTKATRTDYRYADRNVVLGMTYEYALESVDKDGAIKRHEKTVALTVDRTFAFSLEQNCPNPFNPATVIRYTVPGRHSLARQQRVRLKVFDIRGRLVRELVNEAKAPRTYRVIWDGRADNGRAVASALYVCRIEIDKKFVKTRKMIMVK
jgi:hypothetical protein